MNYPWKRGAPHNVFISGGGSGIGRELAVRLAKEGANVAIFNRRLAPKVIAELKRVAVRPDQLFKSYRADVSDEPGLRAAIDKAAKAIGPPDLAINSAGILISAPFAELSSADFNRVIAVNLIGSRNFAAVTLPHLAKGAHLVLVASLAGLVGNFGYAAYSASKFGTVGLAHALRIELKLQGIDVSVCCPGVINTPMVVAEQEVEHPITGALAQFPGMMEVDAACDLLLRGIAKRQFEIVPGLMPSLTALLSRHVPGLMDRIGDDIAAKAFQRSAAR